MKRGSAGKMPVSFLYTADAVCCAAVFAAGVLAASRYFYTIWIGLAAFVPLIALPFLRRLYRKDRRIPKPLRSAGILVRCILVCGSLAAIALPFTMTVSQSWYYPVQRAVYLAAYSDQSCFDFLPAQIPSGAEGLQMRCTPKLFDQRHDAFRMYCYTDSETLAAYRAYAEEHCVLCAAVGHRYDSSEPDEAEPEQQYYANIWKTMLESAGLEAEGAVVYVFSDNLYCTNAVYVTNERTGLFLVSCNNLYGLYS